MKRKMRLCRPHRKAVPASRHPREAWAELLVEFREVFRVPPKPVKPPPPEDKAR